MRRIYWYSLLLISIMLTGCISYWKKDVSDIAVFKDTINIELSLLRPMAIIRQKDLYEFSMVDIGSDLYHKATGGDKFYNGKFEVLHSDKGTPLFIKSITREKMDQQFTILVVAGKIYSKEKKDWVKFEYIWANTGIRRTAPWESKVDEQALKEIIDN